MENGIAAARVDEIYIEFMKFSGSRVKSGWISSIPNYCPLLKLFGRLILNWISSQIESFLACSCFRPTTLRHLHKLHLGSFLEQKISILVVLHFNQIIFKLISKQDFVPEIRQLLKKAL